MEEVLTDLVIPRRRFAFRIGDRLPLPLRIVYYAVLFLTMVYLIFIITKKLLDVTQKVGAFCFDKRNFYTFFFCLFGLAIGTFIVAQLFLGLDPIGEITNFFDMKIQSIKDFFISLLS